MAHKPQTDSNPGALQRGKACLRCRKRKMRCDGAKPACQQCTRAKKGDGCEYDDGKGKTRTQLLRENIARLEQRIRELEDPEYTSPSVTLHDPHTHRLSESSSSSIGSPGSTAYSNSHSPFPSGSASPMIEQWTPLPINGVPSHTPFSEAHAFDDMLSFQPPFELAQMLVDIFAPHHRQCGLEVHMGRLRESVMLPVSEQRHPALMNAIFLWACFISRPGPLCQHESHYLARSLEYLGDALQNSKSLVDAIQASCLLSMYFLSNGRLVEGSYHASAAASLAIQCGLHGGIPHEENQWGTDVVSFALPPAKDAIEEGERIMTFWQVYNLESCWSVVLQKPATTRDCRHALEAIQLPWPQSMDDYEAGQIEPSRNFQTVRMFFDNHVGAVTGGFSTLALRAKASALFERADHLSASWDPRMSPSTIFREEVHSMECTVARFMATLVPLHQLDVTMPGDKQSLVVTHTLAHAALIHLYARFTHDDPVAYGKCLRSARACVDVIKHVSEGDFDFLDPILGPCWTRAAETLVRELKTQESSWPLVNTALIRSEIGTILYALTALSPRFPLLAISVGKIQSRLSEL